MTMNAAVSASLRRFSPVAPIRVTPNNRKPSCMADQSLRRRNGSEPYRVSFL
jgi:hypothetical protein